MSSAERLREARELAGYGSAAAAARKFGWNEGSYRHHENGTRGFDVEQASVYGKVYGVKPGWLLGLAAERDLGRVEKQKAVASGTVMLDDQAHLIEEKLIEHYESVLLNAVDVTQLAGPVPQESLYWSTMSYFAFSKRIAESLGKSGYRQIVGVFAETNEMQPTICMGDLVLVDTAQQKPTLHDQIWLMVKSGRVMIRRLRFDSKMRGTAVADDPAISSLPIDLTEPGFYIFGRIVWTGGQI